MLSLSDEGIPGADSLLRFELRALSVSSDLIDVDARLSDPNTPEEERGGFVARDRLSSLRYRDCKDKKSARKMKGFHV